MRQARWGFRRAAVPHGEERTGASHFEMKVEKFFISLERERVLEAGQACAIRDTIGRYRAFVKGRTVSAAEITDYLDSENVFAIEMFLHFLERNRISPDETSTRNNRLFRDAIRSRMVTARDYDERIDAQSPRFQIDQYYEPKSEDMRRRIAVVLAALAPKPGEIVLDVGCGVGTFAYHAARAGARSFGIDYSEKSIAVARALAGEFNLSDRVSYECGDAVHALPFEDNTFDKVVAADFIEHITAVQKESLLDELVRVLKPGGRMVIFTPNRIREALGAVKARLARFAGTSSDETRLHYGLIDRFTFEKMLKKRRLSFMRQFHDVGRPYLARIPVLNEALSLDLLWVVTK